MQINSGAAYELLKQQKYVMSQVGELSGDAALALTRIANDEPVTHYADPGGPLLQGWRYVIDGITEKGQLREAFEKAEAGADIISRSDSVAELPLARTYLDALAGIRADRDAIGAGNGVTDSLQRFSDVDQAIRAFVLPEYPG